MTAHWERLPTVSNLARSIVTKLSGRASSDITAPRTHRQEYRERLGGLVVEVMAAQLFDEDRIGLAQEVA